MKANQKGFSFVEILVVIVVIGLLGAVGWIVLDRQKTKNDPTKTQTTESQKENTTPQSSQSTVPSGFSEYKVKSFTFLYPSTWTVTATHDKYNTVNVQSPDFKEERAIQAQKSTYYLPSSGYKLVVSDITSNDPGDTLQKSTDKVVSDEKATGSGTHKKITVGGFDALWFDNGYEDTYLVTKVFHQGKITHIQLNAKSDSDPATVKQFEDILVSFKL